MNPYQAYIKQAGFMQFADDLVAPLMRSQNQQQPDPSEQRLRGQRPMKMAADDDLINPVTIAGALGGGAIGAHTGHRAGSVLREASGKLVADAMAPYPGTGTGRMLPKNVRMLNHAHNALAADAHFKGGLHGGFMGAMLGATPGVLMGAVNKTQDMSWLGW